MFAIRALKPSTLSVTRSALNTVALRFHHGCGCGCGHHHDRNY